MTRTEELIEAARRAKYANTYCMGKLANGMRCNAPIPVGERLCEECRKLGRK